MFLDRYVMNKFGHEQTTNNNKREAIRPSRMHLVYSTFETDYYDLKKLVMNQKVNRPTQTNNIDFTIRAQCLICMRKMANHFNLSNLTYFKAVAIMDYALSQIRIPLENYEILFETSVIIASKLFELQTKSLKPTTLTLCQQDPVDFSLYIFWEMNLLQELNWQPNIVTVHDFTELFLQRGILSAEDFEFELTDQQLKSYIDCADKIIENLLFIVIRDFGYYRFTPYALANGIIACARSTMKLEEWSEELEIVTSFKLIDFQEVFDVLKYTITSSHESIVHFANILDKYIANFFRKDYVESLPKREMPRIISQLEEPPGFVPKSRNILNELFEDSPSNSVASEMEFIQEDQKQNLDATMDTLKATGIRKTKIEFTKITECKIECRLRKKISKNKVHHQRFQNSILSDIVIKEENDIPKLKKTNNRRLSCS